ncbi:hypothetical protein ACFWIB_42305 [Streptomyces sp. NPDC127051]|uniref:hypothetical protein n=1 Tax=Streptomyces sp. NPDC127051 TaxID=3347119 RepID=UPI00365D6EB1
MTMTRFGPAASQVAVRRSAALADSHCTRSPVGAPGTNVYGVSAELLDRALAGWARFIDSFEESTDG